MLGGCAYANLGFTRFDPHLRLGPKGWERIGDPLRDYPDDGKIFSRDPRCLDAPTGSFWTFRTEPNPRSEVQGRSRDKLIARDVLPATRIIDLSRDSWEAARYKIVEEGLPVSIGYLAEALILLADDACVRLRFTSDSSGEVWQPHPDMLADLNVLRRDASIDIGATIAGAAFLVPGAEPREVIDCLDWSPNDEFLPKILKRIRRAGHGDMGALTNAAIDALTSFLKSRGMLPGEDPALRRMRRRLQDFLPQFDPSEDQLDAMVSVVEEHRPVADRLSKALEQQKVSLERQLTAQLAAEIRGRLEIEEREAAARVEVALKDAAEAEAMQAETLAKAEAARLEIASVEAALTQEIGELQAVLAAAPPSAGARAAAIASAVSAALRDTRPGTTILPSAVPPWAEVRVDVTAPIGAADLVERIEVEAGKAGILKEDLAAFDALLRGGEIVMLLGNGVSATLAAYARTVSAGRITRFALDPSIIGLDDLWRQAASGVPTPLAYSWHLATSHPSACIFLVIEAINAAPFEFWLSSLAAALGHPNRPRNLLIAATVSSTRWTARSASNDVSSVTVPFSLSATPDAIRPALLQAGAATTGRPTTYTTFEDYLPNPKEIIELISELKELELDDSDAVMRALRVYRAARAVYPLEQSVTLALGVAGLSTGKDDRIIGPLAHGLANLRGSMPREKE